MDEERTKFPRDVADQVFWELWKLLEPVCGVEWTTDANGRVRANTSPSALADRICPVGGYRRLKAEMKDLELLIIPRRGLRADPEDLFGAGRPTNLTTHFLDELVERGILAKRLKCDGSLSAWGDWNRHASHVASGLPIDIFFATAENWWNRLVVTTGPRELNIKIAALARHMSPGWEWEVAEAGFAPLGGSWTECPSTRRTMRSEREVFEFVGLEWLPPEERR